MFTIDRINQSLHGIIEGSGELEVKGVNSLQKAEPGDISFLQEAKFEKFIYTSRASALLVDRDFSPKKELSATLLRVDDVRNSLIALLELFQSNDIFDQGNHEFIRISGDVRIAENVTIGNFSHISEEVEIGDGSRIGAQVFLGKRVKIGKEVTIFPGVKIYHDCQIGDRTIIHANAVIGSDGFGYKANPGEMFEKIPQVGNVVIESDVEIGANTVVDRSTFGSTVVGKGVKLDNLIQVAHNVEIGENTVIAAQSGISGSVTLGKNCIIGGQVAFVPHVQVADGSQFQGQSGVGSSIRNPGERYFGTPAIRFNDYIRSYAVFKQLPRMEKRIRELEKQLENNKKE